MRLEVRVNAQAILGRLDAMDEAIRDPRPALEAVADTFFNKVEPAWLSQAQWQPLAPDSLRRKRRKGLPSRPLLGGTLERSLRGGRYRVRRLNKQSVTVGTRHPLAHIHNKGTRGRGYRAPKGGSLAYGLHSPRQRVGGLPARPLISFSRNDRELFAKVIAQTIMSAEANHYAARLRAARRGL